MTSHDLRHLWVNSLQSAALKTRTLRIAILALALPILLIVKADEAHDGQLVNLLSEALLAPPAVGPSSSCQAPPLPTHETVDCVSQTAFTGKRLETPRKVAHMFLFSFEVDTLEIMLREEFDAVDRFFLVESMYTHREALPKPLLWESLKRDPRFAWAAHKVVHIIVDDPTAMEYFLGDDEAKREKHQNIDIWKGESGTTAAGVRRVLEWNSAAARVGDGQAFAPEDVLISGDVDEVLSRTAIQQLGHCEWKHDITSGALWMPMGSLDKAFRTDWTVDGLPYSFALPTVYKFDHLIGKGEVDGSGARLFRPPFTSAYVLGGMHMTTYSLPALALVKDITATEYSGIRDLPKDLDKYQQQQYANDWGGRRVPLERLSEHDRAVVFVPWWLQCNKHRYPAWYGQPDPRNKQLEKDLAKMDGGGSEKAGVFWWNNLP